MKRLSVLTFGILFSASVWAQNYNDSTILLTLSQRGAWYIGKHVQNQFKWSERLAPAYMKDYIGSGANPDSLFTVAVKASWINGMIEILLASPNEIVQADRLSIINNSPAIPSYTSLATQIVNKANGNTSEKQVAIFIRDYYNQRVADFSNSRAEAINSVVQWSRN